MLKLEKEKWNVIVLYMYIQFNVCADWEHSSNFLKKVSGFAVRYIMVQRNT